MTKNLDLDPDSDSDSGEGGAQNGAPLGLWLRCSRRKAEPVRVGRAQAEGPCTSPEWHSSLSGVRLPSLLDSYRLSALPSRPPVT